MCAYYKNIVLVLVFRCCFVAGNENTVIVYNVPLSNHTPLNHVIATLNHVAHNLFSDFTSIKTYTLTKLVYREGKIERVYSPGRGFSFMQCGTEPLSVNVRYFFCWEKQINALKTTSNFRPAGNQLRYFQFRFMIQGIKSGSVQYRYFDVQLVQQDHCTALAEAHASLKHCITKPNSTTRIKVNKEETEILLPASGTDFIALDNIVIFDLYPRNIKLKLYTSKETLLEKVFTPESTTKLSLKMTTISEEGLTLWLSKDGLLENTTVFLEFYDTSEFCGQILCINRYQYWTSMLQYPGSPSCASRESHNLNKLLSCISDFKLVYLISTSTSGVFNIDNYYALTCHTNVLTPHTFYIFKYNGNRLTVLTKKRHVINALSYDDTGTYGCMVTSKVDGSSITSNNITIEINGIYTVKLQFVLQSQSKNNSYWVTTVADIKKELPVIKQKLLGLNISGVSAISRVCDIRFSFGNGRMNAEFNIYSNKIISATPSYIDWVSAITVWLEPRDFLQRHDVKMSVLSRKACTKKAITIDNMYHVFMFPLSGLGEVAVTCPDDSKRFATMFCESGTGETYSSWINFNDTECYKKYSPATKMLTSLNNSSVTLTTVGNISQNLQNVAMDTIMKFTTYDVFLSTAILENISTFVAEDRRIVDNIFSTIDNILCINDSILRESQERDKSSTRLVSLVNKVSDAISTDVPYNISKKHFVVGGWKVKPESYKGMFVNVLVDQLRFHKHEENYDVSEAHLTLPKDLLDSVTARQDSMSIVVVAYKSDKFFLKEGQQTNGLVLSAEVHGHTIKDLNKPVQLMFRSTNENVDKKCVYWNMKESVWSNKGCNYKGTHRNVTICECDHLTNFAVLFNAKKPNELHAGILTYISYIGLSVSLLGATATLVTYLVFPMLREHSPPKILMNLCVAIICLCVTFLVGLERVESALGCRIVAGCVQYFFLSVLAWSAVEGVHSSKGLVFPMTTKISMFMQKALLFGWGTPLIFTAIGAGIWWKSYGEERSCVVNGKPFFYTVLAPALIVFLFNMVALVLIMISLNSGSQRYSSATSLRAGVRLRIISTFLVLFGITWVFGMLVISNNIVAFQYVFCVVSSLQGFFIFLFYCVRNKRARNFWRLLLSGHSVKKIKRATTRKRQTKNYESSIKNSMLKNIEMKIPTNEDNSVERNSTSNSVLN